MAGGRPSKLTPALKSRLLLLLAAGNYRRVAAAACCIDYATLCRWMKDPRPEYQTLRDDCERAEAQAEAELVGVVRRAAEGDPKVGVVPTLVGTTPRVALKLEPRRFARAQYGSQERMLVQPARSVTSSSLTAV